LTLKLKVDVCFLITRLTNMTWYQKENDTDDFLACHIYFS